MPKVIAIVGSKGGQGKTTTCANLGAYIASLGFKVLFFDADSQPSLSEYYQVEAPIAKYGHVDVFLSPSCIKHAITKTKVPGCDIVLSNDEKRVIEQTLAKNGIQDVIYRLRNALHRNIEDLDYDFVFIDCPGATNQIHKAAVLAADLILCPVTPDTMSFKEFPRGTLTMIKEIEKNLEESVVPWPDLADVYCVINCMSGTKDARDNEKALKNGLVGLYQNFKDLAEDPKQTPEERAEARKILENHDWMLNKGINTLNITIPDHTIYKKATTEGTPVHQLENSKKLNNARNIMRRLAAELPIGIEISSHSDKEAM